MGTQPLSTKRAEPPIFGLRLLWPNGCMDQDAIWYRGRNRPTRHWVTWGPSSPPQKGAAHVWCGQTAGCIKMPLVRPMQVDSIDPSDIVLDGDPACPPPKRSRAPPQYSAHAYCRQTAGWIKMKLGTQVGLSPGYIVLDGDPGHPLPNGHRPQFSTHICCRQMARWIKMPLGRKIGLNPSEIVLDGDPAPLPKKKSEPPISAHVYCGQNGCMDQDATCYGGRLRPRPHCVRCGPSSMHPQGHSPPNFGPCLIVSCGQTAGWIKMPLGTKAGVGPGRICCMWTKLPPPKRATDPNSRPISIVEKRSPISATAEHLLPLPRRICNCRRLSVCW